MGESKGKFISLAPHLVPEDSGREFNEVTQQGLLQSLAGYEDEAIIGTKTVCIGERGMTIATGNYGFFNTISTAYNEHYILKTCPEDWWFCITQKIALAIDANAKKPEVRRFFVSHEGKKQIKVHAGAGVYETNYSWFFDQMAKGIAENISVPEYCNLLETDFSESTDVHKIVGKLVLMTSMKEFFEYVMESKCGIPGVVMKGSEDDWKKLSIKLRKLEVLLKPIEKEVELDGWWDGCVQVCSNLVSTFQGNPDKDWWSRIVAQDPYGSGPCYVRGWFVTTFLGLHKVEVNDLPSGLVTVPMTITDGDNQEASAIVAGVAGFTLKPDEAPCEETGGFYPSVEAVHSWALMLEPDSYFRNKLREGNTSGGA